MRSLRVLFLATRDFYDPATTGGDITMWEFARYLAYAGHSVTYVAETYPAASKERVIDGINVVRLGGTHSLWYRTFWHYMRHCRGKFDVVITEGFGGSRIPRLAPLYVKEPLITEWHQIHRHLFAAQYPAILGVPLNLLERVTAWVHRNTLVRAGTEEWQRAFPTLGFKPENIFVLPVSIRNEWLSAHNGHPKSDPLIVWLGKFRRYKCPDHAIKAMPKIVEVVPNARLVLAGRHDDRRYEQSLAALVQELHLDKNVEFRFDVSESDKRLLLEDSRILVLPSAVEGFGVVVLEANACGVPVVASDRVPEGAVAGAQNGLRYRFGDVEALSESLVRLLTDERLHQELSRNAVNFARAFSWTDVSARFERIVVDAAARSTAAS